MGIRGKRKNERNTVRAGKGKRTRRDGVDLRGGYKNMRDWRGEK